MERVRLHTSSTDGSATLIKAASVPLEGLTPAMRQYVEQKRSVGDAVLLFRMGDFYEAFYEDAVTCHRALGITLTSRDKNSKNPVPLAGIPYHALDGYLKKLVSAGHKVAISEQLEDPKQAKGVVKRDVVRIVTAGTLTDDSLLPATDERTLCCACHERGTFGIASIDLSSGRFTLCALPEGAALDELVRAAPAEIVIVDEPGDPAAPLATSLRDLCGSAITRRPAFEFGAHHAEQTLKEHFEVATLGGFGIEETGPAVRAAGCVLGYVAETQRTALPHIRTITPVVPTNFVRIDHSSYRALEIERTLRSGSAEGTLLHAVDRTVSAAGARTLRNVLRTPLTDRTEIERRQEAIAHFADSDASRHAVRSALSSLVDIERVTSRVALARTNPRDLSGLGRTLAALPNLAEVMDALEEGLLSELKRDLCGLESLAKLLAAALAHDAPMTLREGGFIVPGHDEELDRLRNIRTNGQQWLADYQRRMSEETGIGHLKVGFNRVFGYYIEVPNSAKESVPDSFVRKQTIKSAERYITDELKSFESDVLSAEERANELEYALFERLRARTAEDIEPLLAAARAIGMLDVLSALAELAIERRYVRPEIEDAQCLEIEDGRHPVLDVVLDRDFVPNDTAMSHDARLFVITGPNMAGKSTYIRQVALLVLLAQTGSFVPAKRMRFSLCDRVFARVGSADEIMCGQSTFMVEMTEAARILHGATNKSLVVLDELGRGTSTFDGLSLAWAITEHLASETKCRALVATHYHEMTELAELLRGVTNYNVAVKEYAPGTSDEGIVFLHRITEGGASKSYGIHVARLAGIPKPVIERSRELLSELEKNFERESHAPTMSKNKTRQDDQLALFADPAEELFNALRETDPNDLSPKQAHELIEMWKARFSG